jgi:hypothetical protein
MTNEPKVVYVVTDLPEPEQPNPYQQAWDALWPTITLGLIAVPIMCATALLAGILLGWPLPVLLIATAGALPILINLVDLVGSRAGWPPLSWTVTRIAANRRTRRPATTPPEETHE